VPHSTQLDKERIATSTPESEAGVLVVRRHHLLVRCSHWLNVPILLGLILSGLSIYWASPVYQHKPDPVTGNFDPLADVGIWISTTEDLFGRRRNTEGPRPSNCRMELHQLTARGRVPGVAPSLDCLLRVVGIYALDIKRSARTDRNYRPAPDVGVSVHPL
jgi:hypothetical protein